jgi:hypothetical protein
MCLVQQLMPSFVVYQEENLDLIKPERKSGAIVMIPIAQLAALNNEPEPLVRSRFHFAHHLVFIVIIVVSICAFAHPLWCAACVHARRNRHMGPVSLLRRRLLLHRSPTLPTAFE